MKICYGQNLQKRGNKKWGGGGGRGNESPIDANLANFGPVGNGQGVLVHKVKNKWMKVSIRPHSESVCTGVSRDSTV